MNDFEEHIPILKNLLEKFGHQELIIHPVCKGEVISDEIIQFTGYAAKKDCPIPLRKVVVWDNPNKKEIILLTNNIKFAASTISAIYKDRRENELFFKAIKQNLRIKTFIGTSANAVKIQIWTA